MKKERFDLGRLLGHRFDSMIDEAISKHGRNMQRQSLYDVVLAVLKKDAGSTDLCRSAAAHLVVDRFIKTHSDKQLPTLDQLPLFESKEALHEYLDPIVHENGEGGATKFKDMIADDLDERLARKQEALERQAHSLKQEMQTARRLRPLMMAGLGSIDAYTALWDELRRQSGDRAA